MKRRMQHLLITSTNLQKEGELEVQREDEAVELHFGKDNPLAPHQIRVVWESLEDMALPVVGPLA